MSATTVVNSDMKNLPGWAHRFFTRWRRIEFPAGTKLFKFTEHQLYDLGRTTPWWALLDGDPALHDPGLDEVLAQARRSGRPLREFVRDAYAVMFDWNSLSSRELGMLRVQYARLLKPAVGFHGPTSVVGGNAPPLAYPPRDQRKFPGGAYQVLLPNMSGGELAGTGISLLD